MADLTQTKKSPGRVGGNSVKRLPTPAGMEFSNRLDPKGHAFVTIPKIIVGEIYLMKCNLPRVDRDERDTDVDVMEFYVPVRVKSIDYTGKRGQFLQGTANVELFQPDGTTVETTVTRVGPFWRWRQLDGDGDICNFVRIRPVVNVEPLTIVSDDSSNTSRKSRKSA